jgi:hypothetical protein
MNSAASPIATSDSAERMLVYGDHDERVDTAGKLNAIEAKLQRLHLAWPGLARHSALVSLLIEAGRLQQGLSDARFHDLDVVGDDESNIGRFVHRLAQCVIRSWDSAGAETGDLPSAPEIGRSLEAVQLRYPEGFAFYAVYPEAYADAARALKLQAPPRVIGLRSIGTSLAAIATAALDAPPPVTLRPFGDPSARQVELSPELEAAMLREPAHYIVVDEGPGMSGSSFGAVVDWLRERGVPLDRIAVLPSHDGAPGPSASAAHRAQWDQLQRVPADLGPRLPLLLQDWLRDMLGALDGPLVDISAGKWRRWAFTGERDWPAVDVALERRKFLAFAAGEIWLVKFAGLGGEGERKLEIARRLSAVGLSPEPLVLVHGFLVERWHGNAARLPANARPVAEIGRYIGMRARLLAGLSAEGASVCKLFEMAVRNLEEAGVTTPIRSWSGRIDELASKVRRVVTDNRMLPCEWLRLPDGSLLKGDALDHHRAHDLVGCQDAAWDVAGAIVEFDLGPAEAEELRAAAERAGVTVDGELLQFYLLAYRAFRIGQLQFAIQRSKGDPVELERARSSMTLLTQSVATHRSFVGSS